MEGDGVLVRRLVSLYIAGPTGATGDTGAFSLPETTQAVFGSGTKTHFAATKWVLEAVDADTLQVRATASAFLNVSMTHPTNCSGSTSTLATADMAQRHRFIFATVGDTLSADPNFREIGSDLRVKSVAIHAQVEGSVAKADKPRGKPIFVSRNLTGVWADHAARLVNSGAESIEQGGKTESGPGLFGEIDKGIDKVLIRVAIRV